MNTTISIEELLTDLPTDERNKDAMSVRKLLVDLNKLDRDRASNLAKILRHVKQLEGLFTRGTLPQAVHFRDWIANYRAQIERTEEQMRRRFGKELHDQMAEIGLKLQGQYPRLQAGFFTFQMLPEKGRVEVWYGPEQERLSETPLIAHDLRKRVEYELRHLGSGLEPSQFFARLCDAYTRVRPKANLSDPVPINLVLPEVAFLLQSQAFYQNPVREHYRSYTRADFSYDLYQCGRYSAGERFQLVVATRAHTEKRQDFLWIPNDTSTGGTTYSHLSIKELSS